MRCRHLASHVPIMLLVDGQALLPASLYAWGPAATLRWYLSWPHDPLKGAPPLWFKSIIAAELLLQVPFFVLATRACLDRSASSAWLRVPAVIYGAHTATKLVPILATFALGLSSPRCTTHIPRPTTARRVRPSACQARWPRGAIKKMFI